MLLTALPFLGLKGSFTHVLSPQILCFFLLTQAIICFKAKHVNNKIAEAPQSGEGRRESSLATAYAEKPWAGKMLFMFGLLARINSVFPFRPRLFRAFAWLLSLLPSLLCCDCGNGY